MSNSSISSIPISNEEPALHYNLKGHKQDITAVSFHPDGNQLATSSKDNSVMLWNLSSKQIRCYKFSGHTAAVTCVDYSSNGRLLASGSADCTVRIWIPTVRGESSDFRVHSSAVQTVCFSPDDKNLITGSNDKSIKLWDVKRQRFITSYSGHTNWVRCVKFSHDGNKLASCADDQTMRIWDVKSGQCVHVFTTLKGAGNYVGIHRNDHTVAVATSTGSVRVYDLRSQKLIQHYVVHDNATCLSWHPSASFLLTSGKDRTLRIIDVLEGKPLYTLTGHEDAVSCVTFSKNGESFASGGSDKLVMVWQTNFVTQASPSSASSSNM